MDSKHSVEAGAPDVRDLAADLVALNASRAAFYRALASYYFTELTTEQIERIAAQDLSALGGADPLIDEGFEDMRRFLRRLNSGTRQTLAVDYAHTFLAAGNYESFVATPYESVFTSEAGLLMQEARDEVYKMYCEEHIQPDATLQTPEDHLSFEFEFLATLLERMGDAVECGAWDEALRLARQVQKFHREHQLSWIDDFCDSVLENAQTRFYRGVAKITRGFVHLETEVIADELAVIEECRDAAGGEGA